MPSYPQFKHSWTLLSDRIAIKKLDKSSFLHHGTGIPKEFVSHFTSGVPVSAEGTRVTLIENDAQYQARFQFDATNQRVRLFWKTDFVDLLTGRFPQVHKAYVEDDEVALPPLMMLAQGDDQTYTVLFIDPATANKEWSDLEIEAAVIAYFNMLTQEQEGNQYSKAEMNRQLRDVVLSSRNKQSVEYRMANISSVLEELCHPTIKGYKPRGHVGTGVTNRIMAAIEAHHLLALEDYLPTADNFELDRRTLELRRRGVVGIPKGQRNPKKISSTGSTYERDPAVKAWVLENAEGRCELCKSAAPFLARDSKPFLEVHHVTYLAAGGEDTTENAVALCPNCHREAHYSSNVDVVVDQIKSVVQRLG